ncbi:hypothetical protein FGO68_gene3228 [Halteria grandinella]|uniref:Uncharacterized protein n=1 Tax=Halteria grandinella TaxID=5974 RepID=A0A8J8NVM5_HALGN|nr:hypothetical protein FGO68_gene3228 [Halteria grandinella]
MIYPLFALMKGLNPKEGVDYFCFSLYMIGTTLRLLYRMLYAHYSGVWKAMMESSGKGSVREIQNDGQIYPISPSVQLNRCQSQQLNVYYFSGAFY